MAIERVSPRPSRVVFLPSHTAALRELTRDGASRPPPSRVTDRHRPIGGSACARLALARHPQHNYCGVYKHANAETEIFSNVDNFLSLSRKISSTCARRGHACAASRDGARLAAEQADNTTSQQDNKPTRRNASRPSILLPCILAARERCSGARSLVAPDGCQHRRPQPPGRSPPQASQPLPSSSRPSWLPSVR